MTTGQLVFYSGIGLLIMTIALAILFAVKKPKYNPESIAYIEADGNTKRLRSGYPTDCLTNCKETERMVNARTVQQEKAELLGETELLADDESTAETELIEAVAPTTMM